MAENDGRLRSRLLRAQGLRQCGQCGEARPFAEFSKRKGHPIGYRCQMCRALYGGMRRLKIRIEAIQAYGGKCACCGEARFEFLAIDHKYNDGAEHRRQIRGDLYAWLKVRGWPRDRFQLLCHNCNMSKAFYGYCPHKPVPKSAKNILAFSKISLDKLLVPC